MKMKFLLGLFAFGLGLCLANAQEPTKAIAVLHPTAGNNVTGSVTFTKSGNEVRVEADVTGLTPGKHGFHIHEFGDCSSSDGNAGDLGNIEADASGKAHLEWNDKVMKLSGADSIVGHAVIVHEKADDLKTQPPGNAGGRLACGVIGVAKP